MEREVKEVPTLYDALFKEGELIKEAKEVGSVRVANNDYKIIMAGKTADHGEPHIHFYFDNMKYGVGLIRFDIFQDFIKAGEKAPDKDVIRAVIDFAKRNAKELIERYNDPDKLKSGAKLR